MIADARLPLTDISRPSPARAGVTMVANGCTLAYSSIDAVLSNTLTGDWLSDGERHAAARFRDTRRRRAWLSGRLLLKRLLLKRLRGGQLGEAGDGRRMRPRELEIVSRDAAGRAARPVALLGGRALDCSLSIAHTDCHVLVAVAPAGVAIGVDLVDAQFAPSKGFFRLWFTDAERQSVTIAERQRLTAAERQRSCETASTPAAAVWAIKEAVYKAINRGERFMPQQTEVDWQPGRRLVCHSQNPRAMRCRLETWLTEGNEIAALATLNELQNQRVECHDD